ncbi:MAG: hypothetical protein PUB21_01515 [Bacteroidales bacterium]|nr:hypothetical protein [Bacteroidales bacterium]
MKKIFLIPLFLFPAFLLPAQKGWFEFQEKPASDQSVIDMSDWLDKPAGKHGFMQNKDDKFVFEDGTEIKIWGVNIADNRIFVERPVARKWASYLAKYGVNGVRFHKFSRPGYRDENVSTQLSLEYLDKLDFFSNQLKDQGIYYGWSHIYGHSPQPGDSARLLSYSEIKNAGSGHLKGTTIGLVHFTEDLQDLSIDLTVNMLNHKNPYTGLRYADDPGLSFIELQNEDNIFFATTEGFLMQCPTYKALACREFSKWLKNKYGSHEGLVKAWGKEAIDAFDKNQTGEHLDKENIFPMANHVLMSSAFIYRPDIRKRLLDTALFLFEQQNKFYQRYAKAIRATGYKGALIGSCWQAGDNVAHLYNLYSDYLIGAIDRHNYYGGGAGGHNMSEGKLQNTSMLSSPGSGLMSVGMQAVVDRPFAYSEWFDLSPNEWIAESVPLIAAYGMGLQGWDASYAYACNYPHLVNGLEAPNHGVYNADAPMHMGLYPAVARMIYSNEIKEGGYLGIQKVHIPSLAEGKLGFDMNIEQDWDQKEFKGTIPPKTLVIGKVGIEFVNQFEETPAPQLSSFIDTTAQKLYSTSGQLTWSYGKNNYFTVNAPSTKMWVGFLPRKKVESGGYTLRCENPFAVVSLNSLEKGKTLSDASRILISTMGRTRNKGMEYNAAGDSLISKGEPQLMMEGVRFTLTFPQNISGKICILDHNGERTDEWIDVKGKNIRLDGGRYKAYYYELCLDK